MRIIDKNRDYYDYLQCYNDDVVYDRRNSYILTNDDILNLYNVHSYRYEETTKCNLLLKVGYSNWLVGVEFTKFHTDACNLKKADDYNLELIECWTDYNKCNKLELGCVRKDYTLEHLFSKKYDYKEKLVESIKRGSYEYIKCFMSDHEKIIFNKTKIPSVVKAEDLYNGFDEYLSHLKDDVATDNMSDIEKVESHGFDKKSSFRKIR